MTNQAISSFPVRAFEQKTRAMALYARVCLTISVLCMFACVGFYNSGSIVSVIMAAFAAAAALALFTVLAITVNTREALREFKNTP